MNVFVVRHPAARIESACVAEISSAEVGEVVLVIAGVIIDCRILVKIECVGCVLRCIPKCEGRSGCIVIKRTTTGVESFQITCILAVRSILGDDVLVDIGCGSNQRIRIMVVFIHFPSNGKECHGGCKHAGCIRADVCGYGARSSAFRGALGVLMFRHVPELVVRRTDGHRMVHVALINQAVCLGSLVHFVDPVYADFSFPKNIRNSVGCHRVRIRSAKTVFGTFRIDVISDRKYKGRVSESLAHFKMVTAVMPTATQIVPDPDCRTVLGMACFMEMGIRVAAALDSKKFQGCFKDRIKKIFVDDEVEGSVFTDNQEIGARRG